MAGSFNYTAPIQLGFTPADGDLIRGTANGVSVGGEWYNNGVILRDSNKIRICEIGFRNDQGAVLIVLDSAPTTDYELHLYRYVPSGIVQIPQEYVEGIDGYGIIINSSTPDSTKKFKITVDDTGTISATEVT